MIFDREDFDTDGVIDRWFTPLGTGQIEAVNGRGRAHQVFYGAYAPANGYGGFVPSDAATTLRFKVARWDVGGYIRPAFLGNMVPGGGCVGLSMIKTATDQNQVITLLNGEFFTQQWNGWYGTGQWGAPVLGVPMEVGDEWTITISGLLLTMERNGEAVGSQKYSADSPRQGGDLLGTMQGFWLSPLVELDWVEFGVAVVDDGPTTSVRFRPVRR